MDNLDISDEKFIESTKILGEYCKNSVVVTVNQYVSLENILTQSQGAQ